MSHSEPNLLARLLRKFLLQPAGYGHPISADVADGEYRSGAWAHFHHPTELPRQQAVVDYILHCHTRPTILDLGCGSGRLAQLLQPHQFHQYLGVDLSPEGLRQACALGLSRSEFIEGNFETWRPGKKFDVIVFNECLGYAHDPGATIAAFLPWLRPGGAVVVSYYRSGNWVALWRRIERHTVRIQETTVTNRQGQIWDIRLLRPSVS